MVGHLPQKQQDYRKRYRTLASTYLTFGPDGSELLVNLGGEQIYLFDVNKGRVPQKFDIPLLPHTNGVVKGQFMLISCITIKKAGMGDEAVKRRS